MKHRGEGSFIQTKNIRNNNRSGERVQYDNRSVNQLNQNHFNMPFQQSGTTAYPPSNISSGNHNRNHLHFENNSDQMKTYIDVCDQLKENNYNDFIELEPRDNDLIVQPDMTNDDTSERDIEYVDNNKMETCTQTVQNSESETVQNSESE